MDTPSPADAPGFFDARYLAFLQTISNLRPRLHRYCSRMTGSVLDGEDVVQEALFQAYRKLDTFDDSQPLAPWLFKIAHNRCIDFLRRRGARRKAEAEAATPDFVPAIDPPGPALSRAVERLVLTLPPKERVRAPGGCLRLFAGGDRGPRRLHGRRGQGRAQPRADQARGKTRAIGLHAGAMRRPSGSCISTSSGSTGVTGMG
jgi:RNA polymerase sigma-70 factor (ECF subfamily)